MRSPTTPSVSGGATGDEQRARQAAPNRHHVGGGTNLERSEDAELHRHREYRRTSSGGASTVQAGSQVRASCRTHRRRVVARRPDREHTTAARRHPWPPPTPRPSPSCCTRGSRPRSRRAAAGPVPAPAHRPHLRGRRRRRDHRRAADGLRRPARAQPHFEQVPAPFAIVVPGGGQPTLAACGNQRLIDYVMVADAAAEIVMSVCTGAIVLARRPPRRPPRHHPLGVRRHPRRTRCRARAPAMVEHGKFSRPQVSRPASTAGSTSPPGWSVRTRPS